MFQCVSVRVFGTHEDLSGAARCMLPSVVGRSAASVCRCGGLKRVCMWCARVGAVNGVLRMRSTFVHLVGVLSFEIV